MMMFETSKHVPKTEKCCCVFENNRFICANKTICLFIYIIYTEISVHIAGLNGDLYKMIGINNKL